MPGAPHSPDVGGVFALAQTREEVEFRMAEALGRIWRISSPTGPFPIPHTHVGHIAALALTDAAISKGDRSATRCPRASALRRERSHARAVRLLLLPGKAALGEQPPRLWPRFSPPRLSELP